MFLLILVGATGCAAVAPFASTLAGGAPSASLEVHSQTAVRLSEANFVTLRTNLVGSSEGFRLLGFITLRPATVNEAMTRLYATAQAQEGRPETLANLVVEHSGIYVILFSIPRVTIRADLIEFIPAREEDETPSRTFDVHPVSASKPVSAHTTRSQW
jgi:hypothetical protein